MRLRHPALLKSSGWTYSGPGAYRFRELCAAQRWGCPSPEAYDALPFYARLDIVTWYEATWRMERVNEYEAQRERERVARRGMHAHRPRRRR